MVVIGLTAVIKDGEEVLMQHRDNKPGLAFANMWCIPGGHVETGESDEMGARREIREETGYVPVEMELVTEMVDREVEEVKWAIFKTKYDEKQKIDCNEGQEMRWVGREELQKLNVIPRQKEIIEKLIR